MMSLDSRSHAKLLWIGALLAPAIAVQGVRLLADAELTPVAASSTQAASEPAAAPAPVQSLSPRQQAALAWLETTARVPSRSPLDQPARPRPADPQGRDQPGPEQGPSPDRPAPAPIIPDDRPTHLKLSGMVGSDANALAAISGKLRRVGEEPAPGWVIQRIDSRHRVVVLKHADGREFTISPPTPDLLRQ